jgi:hypothetical protein
VWNLASDISGRQRLMMTGHGAEGNIWIKMGVVVRGWRSSMIRNFIVHSNITFEGISYFEC